MLAALFLFLTATLRWHANPANPRGTTYDAYRRVGPCPPGPLHNTVEFKKLNTAAIDGTEFKDNTVQARQTYCYVVTAVPRGGGVQSVPSNDVQIVIP